MSEPHAMETVDPQTVESLVSAGDLSKLTPDQRNKLYMGICNSMGLNPMTQPFEYIRLNGKLVLYARRNCTDQLMATRGISTEILNREFHDNLFTVEVKAWTKDGRQTTDIGSVSIQGVSGVERANCLMKAFTKAKRRAVLSLVGLSFLDETEVESISPLPLPSPQTEERKWQSTLPLEKKFYASPSPTPSQGKQESRNETPAFVSEKGIFKYVNEVEVEKIREGFRNSGLKSSEIKTIISQTIGEKPTEEWTASDLQNLIDFLGDSYPASA